MNKFFDPEQFGWRAKQQRSAYSFTCGYCGNKVSSEKGYVIGQRGDGSGDVAGGIYICPNCQGPTFITLKNQRIPDEPFGNEVLNVPEDMSLIYEEARKSASTNCYTAAVLLCRKILMHIAVKEGADEGKNFLHYVNYLADQGYVPPNGRDWVDHIRKKGNEANHEIVIMGREDARDLLIFVEMLLKFIYEFPGMISTEES